MYEPTVFQDQEERKKNGDAHETRQKLVYAKIPWPGDNCRFPVMDRGDHAGYWGTVTPLAGSVVLNARARGCYQTGLRNGVRLALSHCCGAACNVAAFGLPELKAADVRSRARDEPKDPMGGPSGDSSHAAQAKASLLRGHGGEKTCVESRDDNEKKQYCRVARNFGSVFEIGKQVAVSMIMPCEGETECQIHVTQGIEHTTAFRVQDSYTLSGNSGDTTAKTDTAYSMQAEKGGDMASMLDSLNVLAPPKTKTETRAYFKAISESWMKLVGIERSSTFSQSTTQVIPQPPGTKAVLTFTPTVNCSQGIHECNGDLIGEISTCYRERDEQENASGFLHLVYL